MASTTPNINLTLPTGAEKVSRQIINDNNTIIDGKMGAVPVGQNLQGEIDALNGNLSNYIKTVSKDFTKSCTAGESGYLQLDLTGLGIPQYPSVVGTYVTTSSVASTSGFQCTPIYIANNTAFIHYYAPTAFNNANFTFIMAYYG